MIKQLNPPIPVYVTKDADDRNDAPEGSAMCHGWVFDYEHDLLWVCFMDKTGETWVVPNWRIRGMKNYTLNRDIK